MACSGPNDGCSQGQFMNYLDGSCKPCPGTTTTNTPATPVGSSAPATTSGGNKKATAQDWAAWITAGGAALTGAAALTAAIKGNNNAPANPSGGTYTPPADPNATTDTGGMSTGVKIGLAVGALLLVGGIIYLFRSRSNA